MKSLKFLLPFILLALIVLPLQVALAASARQVPQPSDIVTLLTAALQIFTALVGYPAAVAAASAIALKLGAPAQLVADASGVLNVIVFAGVAYLLATGNTGLVTLIDNALGGVAKLLADIVVVLGGFAAARVNTSSYLRGIVAHTGAFHEAAARLRG